MNLEDLGLIGNCQYSALVNSNGAVVWCCLPRFDSEPIFASLLDEENGGDFRIGAPDGKPGQQAYIENTNILQTTFKTSEGTFRVTDFAPRYTVGDRLYRPTELIRMVEPLEGSPRVSVRCMPRLGWSKREPSVEFGPQCFDYGGFGSLLRLTTDAPVSYLDGEPFRLSERRYFVLSFGPPSAEPFLAHCEQSLAETIRYWTRWVKHCNVPAEYQREVIRSALVLKLHCFEDTGAIVAAMTTSIPESAGSGRTWDYRYCWLRDAYYTLDAFRLLGHFEERESFTRYLLNIAGGAEDLALAPLYRIDGKSDLEEHIMSDWPGFGGNGPVRVGNAASTQAQNDIFGEVVLALSPVFLDDRYSDERSPATLKLLEQLTRKAIAVAGTPDAGIWEMRSAATPRTFSSLMCWAAANRMGRVAARTGSAEESTFRQAAARIQNEMETRCWNDSLGSFVGSYGGSDLDASLLQMATLSFLPVNDPRLASTIDALTQRLSRNGWLLRYHVDDGFGEPSVAFIICTFWLAEALARIGRLGESRAVLRRAHAAMSPLGLLGEDYEATTLRMWGNFPQAYSHVGLIHAAFAAAAPWSSVM